MHQGRVFPLDHVEPADAGADVHARAVGEVRSDLELGLLHGELGGRQGELNEQAHLLYFLLLNVQEGVEALDLRRDGRRKARRIKMGDGRNAAPAGQQVSAKSPPCRCQPRSPILRL